MNINFNLRAIRAKQKEDEKINVCSN